MNTPPKPNQKRYTSDPMPRQPIPRSKINMRDYRLKGKPSKRKGTLIDY